MKKIISKIKLLLSMALMLTIISGRFVGVNAMFSDTQSTPQKEVSSYERLKDEAGLLSEDEAENLLAQLDEISERQSCDVIVVTGHLWMAKQLKAMQMIILILTVMDWVRTETEFFCFCQWKTAIGRLVLTVLRLQPLPMQDRTI